MKTPVSKTKASPLPGFEWDLRLYVADANEKSQRAFENLKVLCEAHLAGRYHIEVIDLVTSPQLAQADQILALPTLVRKLPLPIRKLIGDLSNTDGVLVSLGVRPNGGPSHG